ncbi:hypothetical protein SAMN04488515_0125 [Cognatiyoonia koreensis]|uniref:Uncharacterized protein n=1 Tax=Cognatiyoonia koreensis TaxID=364200 RepID=A0A1I0MMY8_9RHOB|nr:hypothetical protein SAMN04488515_0125 [Cognatiyoonia koreensis]
MWTYLTSFQRDEDGAVAVDWVVLAAPHVLLGVLIGDATMNGATAPATEYRRRPERADHTLGQPQTPGNQGRA